MQELWVICNDQRQEKRAGQNRRGSSNNDHILPQIMPDGKPQESHGAPGRQVGWGVGGDTGTSLSNHRKPKVKKGF